MEAIYKILNNQDKVTMKHFYHIRCNPELGECFCAMRHIPCACSVCVEQLSKPWLPNQEKTQQPRYAIEPETCKYSSILRGYNKWYIAKLNLKKEGIKPDERKIKDELFLQGMTQAAADEIEYNNMGAFQTSDKNTHGYYIVKWTGNAYTLQGKYKCHAFDPPVIITEGELVCKPSL